MPKFQQLFSLSVVVTATDSTVGGQPWAGCSNVTGTYTTAYSPRQNTLSFKVCIRMSGPDSQGRHRKRVVCYEPRLPTLAVSAPVPPTPCLQNTPLLSLLTSCLHSTVECKALLGHYSTAVWHF